MLPLLESVKLVLELLLGSCQKLPQPVRKPAPSVAANINPAQLPIFIAAPHVTQ